MSMRTYGGMITGCVIRKDQMDAFIDAYIRKNPDEFQEFSSTAKARDEMETLLKCNEAFTGSAKGFNAQLYDEELYYDTASFYNLTGVNEWTEDLEMPFILVESDKHLLTKFVLEEKYYSGKEEIIEEFRAKLRDYLPSDFDYERSIGDLEYAIFC